MCYEIDDLMIEEYVLKIKQAKEKQEAQLIKVTVN